MPIERLNPEGMCKPNKNIYSQVVTSTGTKTVHIAGTVPFDEDGNVVGIDDMKLQVQTVLNNIRISLATAGATPADVIRINVYTLNVDDYVNNGAPEVIAFFGDNKPTSTTVQVSRLVHPEWIVEIEATAVID